MKFFLLLITLVTLFSCRSLKEIDLDNNSNLESSKKIDTLLVNDTINNDTIIDLDTDGDGFLDSLDKCPEEYGIEDGCPVVSFLIVEKQDLEKILEKKSVNKKTENLKIVDYSTSDTSKGWVAYSVPEEMKVSKTYSIKVRISKKSSGQTKSDLILGDDDFISNPDIPTVATIEDVKVSGEMSAEIRFDSDAFDIKPLSSITQNIDEVSYTEWEWIVTPKRSGSSPIKLVIKVKDLNKDIVVFNKNIKVEKNTKVVLESFFNSHWQWLMTTIIIPIFIYFWNRKKKKKS